jgi:hypothetical protein
MGTTTGVLIPALLVVALLLGLALIMMRSKAKKQESDKQKALDAKRSARQKRQNWLVGIEGGVQGKTYHLGAREATLGRKVGNYIQVMDEKVSRVHVKMRAVAGGLEVIDEESEIGTKINGELIGAKTPRVMKHGDTLQIGDNVFRYEAEAEYETNHGLTEQKVAGAAQHRPTAAMAAISWQDDVRAALEAGEGDIEAAAKHMGVDAAIFRKMMEQAGIQQ